MDKNMKQLMLEELRPNGVWQLPDDVKSVLKRQISRLPKEAVEENEDRYPERPAAMRAFLVKFFARHYLQTQNSLIEYISSQDFYNIIRLGHLRILDVGCGPAVASLAITDMLSCLIRHLKNAGEWPRWKKVKVDYVLNDTSSVCLGTGKGMLTDYFKANSRRNRRVSCGQVISIQKGFPDNLKQLQRVRFNLGKYDIAIFSYVASTISEERGFENLVLGLFSIEKLCNYSGRILILKDRFSVKFVQRLSEAIGVSSNFEQSVQQIYPKRNMSETFPYWYYSHLYIPTKKMMIRQNDVA
jgi:hypothetical protein